MAADLNLGMNRLGSAHRRLLYLAGAALLISGAAWTVLRYVPDVVGVDARAARSLGAGLLACHGAAAMLALIGLGTLLPHHVGAGWRSGKNRRSGVFIGSIAGILVVTAYLLYYAGDEMLRGYASWIHIAAGGILPAVIAKHVWHLIRPHASLRRGLRSAVRTSGGVSGMRRACGRRPSGLG